MKLDAMLYIILVTSYYELWIYLIRSVWTTYPSCVHVLILSCSLSLQDILFHSSTLPSPFELIYAKVYMKTYYLIFLMKSYLKVLIFSIFVCFVFIPLCHFHLGKKGCGTETHIPSGVTYAFFLRDQSLFLFQTYYFFNKIVEK